MATSLNRPAASPNQPILTPPRIEPAKSWIESGSQSGQTPQAQPEETLHQKTETIREGIAGEIHVPVGALHAYPAQSSEQQTADPRPAERITFIARLKEKIKKSSAELFDYILSNAGDWIAALLMGICQAIAAILGAAVWLINANWEWLFPLLILLSLAHSRHR